MRELAQPFVYFSIERAPRGKNFLFLLLFIQSRITFPHGERVGKHCIASGREPVCTVGRVGYMLGGNDGIFAEMGWG
jgi:hypothetical protein